MDLVRVVCLLPFFVASIDTIACAKNDAARLSSCIFSARFVIVLSKVCTIDSCKAMREAMAVAGKRGVAETTSSRVGGGDSWLSR